MGQSPVSTINWRRLGVCGNLQREVLWQVLGGRIRGEDVEPISKDPFESVEARIISSSEGKVLGVTGRAGRGVVLK